MKRKGDSNEKEKEKEWDIFKMTALTTYYAIRKIICIKWHSQYYIQYLFVD